MKAVSTSFFLFLISFVLNSCAESETKKSLEFGDDLLQSIDKFDNERSELSSNVSNTVEKTTEEISKSDVELSNIAINWEENLTGIINEYDNLQKSFQRVVKSSNEYLLEMNRVSNEISNPSLKESELSKNRVIKEQYLKYQNEAELNINKISEILQKGKDYQYVLTASAMRQKLDENIKELNEISTNACRILKDLEEFTLESKKLLLTQ